MRYHELRLDNLNETPIYIQNKIIEHLKNRLGDNNYGQLNHYSTYIYSNEPIKRSAPGSLMDVMRYGNDTITTVTGKGIDSIYDYPLYATNFELNIPELNIKELALQLVIDKNAEIVKDIEYPENGFKNFIPIDSIHSELIRRKIASKKLSIHLTYSEKGQTFIWSAATVISQGSILGGGCIPEVDDHFKMDAFSGHITEYTSETREEYFSDLY
ncbi:MAG: hypothetical protein KUG49_01855 [Dokdonia sp.]|nr:hypothetical protein [Dokdonia sp.]